MQNCVIDGKTVEFTPGENLVEVAKRAGIEIPVFCYHPGLSVVAQCRMCVVEVEKMGKLQTACSTAAAPGMVVKTKSAPVEKQRKAVMEFLLLNHPLDCPICDKSGECDLQDHSFGYGDAYMRSTEERRYFVDVDMGPVIQKNMNRCIHCTRCIRFGDEIAGIHEMVALKRGNNTEITTLTGLPLETKYAGNYADVCPTGSLTLKDFRFHKRVWMLKKTPTVCEGCSRGCNMEIHHENDEIFRCLPRTNMEVNKYWLCDEGRMNYHYTMDSSRILEPKVAGSTVGWTEAVQNAKTLVGNKKAVLLVGSDLTLGEGALLQEFSKRALNNAPLYHFGTPGILTSQDDADEDKILRRLSKTSNLHGMEKLAIDPWKGTHMGAEIALVFRGGRAVLPEWGGIPAVGFGVFFEKEASRFQTILPGAAFSEKNGTIVNSQGMKQKLVRAVLPPGDSKEIAETLMLWMHAGNRQVGAA